MSGEKSLAKLIASMNPVLSADEYVFVCLKPADHIHLAELDPIGTFKETEGLTAILLKHKADEHNINYTTTFRCITLNVHSSLEAVGLTAAVSNKLTEYQISANVVAAYFHDHIFVGAQDADKAMIALAELSQD